MPKQNGTGRKKKKNYTVYISKQEMLSRRSRRVDMLLPYGSYLYNGQVYAIGRVVRRRHVVNMTFPSTWRSLKNNFHRFATSEYEGISVRFKVLDMELETVTDKEGYFFFEEKIDSPIFSGTCWSHGMISTPEESVTGALSATVKTLCIGNDTERAVICDIDDTIMISHVSSWLRLKMFFYSFTKSASQREPVKDMAYVLQKITCDSTLDGVVPIFYVSNSPWNIYDFILDFIDHNDFPEGPVFLRDYGFQMIKRKKKDPIHKMQTISQILTHLHKVNFILIGDSSEHDLKYYLDIASTYPERIENICIRDVGQEEKFEKLKSLIDQHELKDKVIIAQDVKDFLDIIN